MSARPQEVLSDVRRAYRLLHDYQRLVLDSLTFVGTQLGFTYRGGWHKFCAAAPRNGKGGLDCWAWDWLGLYYYEFHFDRTLPSGTRQILAALHMPDTGGLGGNPSDTSAFPVVEESKSRMAFIFSNQPDRWTFPPITSGPESRRMLAEEGKLPEECIVAGMSALVCDMERLFTEESALGVIAELRSSFGIPADAKITR